MNILTRIALVLVIIGAINWGLIGAFQFDLVAAIFGGQDAGLARVVYALVGISGLVCIGLLFKDSLEQDHEGEDISRSGNMAYSTEFAEETDISDEERKK